jgi:hypothetical protein
MQNRVQKSHVALHPSNAALPKFFVETQPPEAENKNRPNASLQGQNSSKSLNFVPVLSIPTTPITLPSSFPEVLPCYHPAFTRRRSQQLTETFRAENFSDSFSPPL